MLLRHRMCVTGPAAPDPELPIPLVVDLPGGGTATLTEGSGPGDFRLTIEKTVDLSSLALRPARARAIAAATTAPKLRSSCHR